MSGVDSRTVFDRCRLLIRAVLRARGVDRAGVFGSVARGNATAASDLDIIVSFQPGARRELVAITADLEAITGLSVDVVDDERVMERARRLGVGTTILRDTIRL